MTEPQLDRIVKGAPPPHVSVPQVAAAAAAPATTSPSPALAQTLHESKKPASPPSLTDPLSSLPSSPPQIYLNLLILEASLRSQYLTYRARRHLYDTYLLFIISLILFFGYLVFYREREDGQGRGGSPYGIIDASEKIAFFGSIISLFLVWGTGQWERGVRYPRRWVAVTNRGLRPMNLKIVLLRGPLWKRFSHMLASLYPYSSFYRAQGSTFRYVETSEKRPAASSKYVYRDGYQSRGVRLEDIQPGGDHLKLLLQPKPFSPEFRENWELFRAEYWEKENERRAQVRQVVRNRQRELAKEQGGWLWWTGWRGWRRTRGDGASDLEQLHLENLRGQFHQRPPGPGARKRRASTVAQRQSMQGESHSRSSSRSSTGTPEGDEIRGGGAERRDGRAAGGAAERKVGRRARASATGRATRQTRSMRMSATDAAEPMLAPPPDGEGRAGAGAASGSSADEASPGPERSSVAIEE